MNKIKKCPICSRELGNRLISKHHLIPKSKGGKYSEVVTLGIV